MSDPQTNQNEDNLPVPQSGALVAVDQLQSRNALVDVAKVEVLGRIKGAISSARDFPRDETTSLTRILTACNNRALAEKAIYMYPRGGEKISGPSIRLAEAIAQRWTNLDFGIREVEAGDGHSVVEAYCWDLETNVRQTRTFTVRHERKAKNRIQRLTDPRDVYEHIANYGARRMRACILAVIPKEVVDQAMSEVKRVLTRKDQQLPLTERIAYVLKAFEKLGVKQELIESRLGHEVKHIDDEELFELRGILNSLGDGQSKRSDWFDVPAEPSDKAEELTEILGKKSKKKEPKAADDEKLPFEKE